MNVRTVEVEDGVVDIPENVATPGSVVLALNDADVQKTASCTVSSDGTIDVSERLPTAEAVRLIPQQQPPEEFAKSLSDDEQSTVERLLEALETQNGIARRELSEDPLGNSISVFETLNDEKEVIAELQHLLTDE